MTAPPFETTTCKWPVGGHSHLELLHIWLTDGENWARERYETVRGTARLVDGQTVVRATEEGVYTDAMRFYDVERARELLPSRDPKEG